MFHAEGEDPFEALEREMDQDQWGVEMLDNDGMEGGMEKGLIDEELAQLAGFNGGAGIDQEGEVEGAGAFQEWWGVDEDRAGTEGIEELSTKELESIVGQGREQQWSHQGTCTQK